MPRLEPITSSDDARIQSYRDLPDATLAAREGLFVIESELVARIAIERHVAGAIRLQSLLVTPTKLRSLGEPIARLDCPVYVGDPPVIDAIAGFHVHRGVLGLGERSALPSIAQLACRARRLLALEDLSNHDNVGGLFRVAAAFGVDGVVLSPRTCDPLYRKAIRVSMGHALRVPFARMKDWPAGLAVLRHEGWRVLAMVAPKPGHPANAANAPDYWQSDREHRLVVMVGAEGPGLTPLALAQADCEASIPMSPGVDSLNVVVAAGIALSRIYSG